MTTDQPPTGFVRGNDRLARRRAEDPATATRVDAIIEEMGAVDQREDDDRLLAVALMRSFTDSGARHEWADVAAELGIDLEDLDQDGE